MKLLYVPSLAFIAIFLISARPLCAEVFHQEKLAAIDAEIEQAIREAKIVGGAVWVEHGGSSYHKAYGMRAKAPEPELMTEDTIFDLASVSKVLGTTSAVMLCVERGLIGVDDLVSQHIPEFTGDGREKVTIRHLLLHSSGLPLNPEPKLPFSRNQDEAVARACRTPLLSEPGKEFAYSNATMIVLAGVVERVTGRSLDEFCTTEIFRPLGMENTLYRPSGDRLKRVSPSSSPARGLVDDVQARDMGGVAGHCSLFSTGPDLARFARMMLKRGELDGVRVFRPETVKQMTRVQSPPDLISPDADGLPVRRGLGWDIDTPYRQAPHDYSLARGSVFPIGSYGHVGWTGQYVWIDPFSQTFVVFLCNRYGDLKKDTRMDVYHLHHRISTLAAEAVADFDFSHVPDALPKHDQLRTKSD